MQYIEAPSRDIVPPTDHYRPGIFLAGGITGCRDWQAEVADKMKDLDVTIYNPRRKDWPNDIREVEKQIAWEHDMLRAADAVLFWFTPETLNPIVLYELGAMTVRGGLIFVGADPQYKRLDDVRIQTHLERPHVVIHSTLDDLVAEVRSWVKDDHPVYACHPAVPL